MLGYFIPGFFNVAKAECKYDVRLDITPSNATWQSNLAFTITVKIASGSSGGCAQNVRFVYKIQTKDGWGQINGYLTATSMKAGVVNSSQAIHNANLNLSNFFEFINNYNVANLNSLVFSVNVYEDNYSGKEAGSAGKTISVSGSTGQTNQSGEKDVRIMFNANEYTKGDNLQVQFEPQNISATDPEVNVYTNINGKNVGNFKINIADLFKQTDKVRWQNVVVNETNGFKNGENTVEVIMKVSTNQNVIFGRGSGKVNATGLSAGANAGSGAGGGAGTGAGTGGNVGANTGAGNTGAGGGTVDTSLKETLFNPLPSDSLTGTLLGIAKGFLAVVGLWGVVFVMIGGFKMVIANGNEEAITAAKKTITWAVLGVVVALLSFSIIAIVQNLLGADIPEPPQSSNIIKPNENV